MPVPVLTYNADPDWTIAGFTEADRTTFTLDEEIVNLPGTPESPGSDNGHGWNESVTDGAYNRWRAYIDEPSEELTPVMESLDPDIAERDATGAIAWVSDGTARIRVSYPGREAKIYRQAMEQTGLAEVVTLTGLLASSLVKHAHDALYALISAFDPGQAAQRYISANNLDPDSPSVTLDTGHFAHGELDFSAVSVISEIDSTARENAHVALISADHASCAKHFCPGVGDRVTFRRSNGTYQTVTVATKTDIGGDLSILEFSAPVTGITPLEVISQAQLETYAPVVSELGDRHALLGVRRTRHFADGAVGSGLLPQLFRYKGSSVAYAYSESSNERMWEWLSGNYGEPGEWIMGSALSGDSGGPSFLIIDDTPVLLGHAYTTFSFPLVAATSWLSDVNTALGAHTVQHPDLSAFTDFS